jgi:hypothetical protein
MLSHISIQWMGIRKDSGRGSIWAWFTETGKPCIPPSKYRIDPEEKIYYCHVIWGSIGKKCQIETYKLTDEFLQWAQARSNNYKQIDPEKVTNRWGKSFNEELSMHLLLLKMKG